MSLSGWRLALPKPKDSDVDSYEACEKEMERMVDDRSMGEELGEV